MKTALSTCIVEPGLAILTRHTHTDIIENQSPDRFLIPSTWTQSNCMDALLIWAGSIAKTKNACKLLAWAKQLGKTATRKSFAKELDAQLRAAFIDKTCGPIKPLREIYRELLIALWTKDCIVWPSETSVLGWPSYTHSLPVWNSAEPLVNEAVLHLAKSKSTRLESRCHLFMRLLLSRSFIDDSMALVPRSDTKALANAADRQDLSAVAKMIIDLQRQKVPHAQHFECSDFTLGNGPKPGSRSDPEFRWAIRQDQRWDKWRAEATQYLAMLRRGRGQALAALNAFLDYAQEHRIPYEPQELFVSPGTVAYPAFSTGRSVDNPRNAMLKRFLDHVLDGIREQFLSQGQHQQASLLRIPIPIPEPAAMPAPTQSHRDPMPQHLVELCIQILTENDYAWPKSFMGRGASDWISRLDPSTGKTIRVWSPVRTSVLLAKLMLPARTMQIRMLDSGEADTERFDPLNRSWKPNPNSLGAHSKGRVQNGVFRAYPREDGSRGSLIYFNTNKTADINQPLHKRGHLMAWEHEGALKLFASLRDWQEQYNPLAAPTSWTALGKQRSECPQDLAARGSACFLFRDPTQSNPTLPITNGKVQILWARLMEEAEKRLADRGDRRHDGSPIQLVLSRTNGMPARLAYDLHSLRVTMITALYDNGVPVDRLMKVAGHCATLMTLYYVKESREKISLTLTEANDKRSLPQTANAEWKEFLKRPHELPRSLASGAESNPPPTRSRVIFMDEGLCLNGGHGCPRSSSTTQNCVQCPHFATGPGFLPGLQSECEDLLDAACEAGAAYQKAELDIGALRFQKAKGESVVQSELDAGLMRFERCMQQVDDLNRSLFATYAFARQCLKLAGVHSDRPVMVTSPQSVDVLRRAEVDTFDRTLAAMSQQADIYQTPPMSPTTTELNRLRFLNKSLGAQPPAGLGFQISDEIRQAISVQMGLWAKLRMQRRSPTSLSDSVLEKLCKTWGSMPQKMITTAGHTLHSMLALD